MKGMKALLLSAIVVLLLGRAISDLTAEVKIDGSSTTENKPQSKEHPSKGRKEGDKKEKERIHPLPPLPVARDKMPMFDPENKTIFVSIASYRDPELNATLADLFGKAMYPGMLRVTVLLQEDEDFLERGEGGADWFPQEVLSRGGVINILPRNYKEARGAGEARATIQEMYQNETYYMQLDSHHRFAMNWDSRVISKLGMLERFSKKPGKWAAGGSGSPVFLIYVVQVGRALDSALTALPRSLPLHSHQPVPRGLQVR